MNGKIMIALMNIVWMTVVIVMFIRNKRELNRKYDESYQLRREISYLKETLSDRDDEIRDLEKKIKHDGPIVNNPELKRCTSEYCRDCKYVIKSSHDNRPLRCIKGVVCEDYRL